MFKGVRENPCEQISLFRSYCAAGFQRFDLFAEASFGIAGNAAWARRLNIDSVTCSLGPAGTDGFRRAFESLSSPRQSGDAPSLSMSEGVRF